MTGFFLIVGIACLLYYVVIVAYAGLQLSFSGIWLLISLASFAVVGVKKSTRLLALVQRIPEWARQIAAALFILGLVGFLVAQGCIISGMRSKPQQELDGIIVLGAQVRGTRVSRALAQRLNAAADYLEKHPDAYVIVSGGQGPGEDLSEAEAMSLYLQEKGIPAERIILEDQSTSTAENLGFSFELLKDPEDEMGVVTNGFHVFRAVHIARAQGVEVTGVAAKTDWWMLPHYMMREAFALVKDFLVGNAK